MGEFRLYYRARHPRFIDLAATEVRGIKVLRRADGYPAEAHWWCVCPKCGDEFVARSQDLRKGEIERVCCLKCKPARVRHARARREERRPKVAKARRSKVCKLCYGLGDRRPPEGCPAPPRGCGKPYEPEQVAIVVPSLRSGLGGNVPHGGTAW